MDTVSPAAGENSQGFVTVKECQQVELSIMKELHRYCGKHQITYAMAYGTLLGAVRHKGFIPWDNDMDIVMPRPDYERFIRLVQESPIADHLYLLHHSIDPHYHYQCARVCDSRTEVAPAYIREQPGKMGLWVDIFPIDGVWDTSIRHLPSRAILRMYKVLQRADIYALPDGHGWKNHVKNLLQLLFPNKQNHFQKKVDQLGMRWSFDSSDRVGNITEFDFFGESFPKDDLTEPVLLPFEDAEFYAPRNWDAWLATYYGDYMKLPPEEKRMTHDLNAKWA